MIHDLFSINIKLSTNLILKLSWILGDLYAITIQSK
jgi:hypothetical protein